MMAAEYDLTMLLLDFPRPDRCDDSDWVVSADALVAAAKRTGGRAAVVATLPEAFPERHALALAEAGIAPLFGLDEALAAIAGAAEAGEFAPIPSFPRKRESTSPPVLPHGWVPAFAGMTLEKSRPRTLSEWEGKRALAGYGVIIPEGRLAASIEEAVAAARTIGFPVAVKTVGASIAHKTETGAVRLNLKDVASVTEAATALFGIGDTLLVERMVPDGIAELIVGIDRDPVFGLYLVVGSGGILVELVGDRRLMLLPASESEIRTAIGELKAAKLLAGYRGKPAGDVDAAVAAILAIQEFALNCADRLLELDVNPLIARPAGLGAVAVDVLIRLGEER
jgi:acyl-CoA synthetase (NDP forming)